MKLYYLNSHQVVPLLKVLTVLFANFACLIYTIIFFTDGPVVEKFCAGDYFIK